MNAPLFPDVIVNGERISHALIAAEAQNHTAPRGKPGIAWRKAAKALALRALLLQEAQKIGLAPDPQQVGPDQFETIEEAQVRALLDRYVPIPAPDGTKVRAAYDNNPEAFRAPPLWEVSHILIACDPRDRDASDAAHVRVKEMAEKLATQPEAFTQLARQNSDCGSANSGGALGQIRPGDTVPEFEAELRKLEPGQISPSPIQTRHGWHLIRIDAMAPGEILPFEGVQDQISDALANRAWAKKARKYIAELVARAEISGVVLAPGEAM